MASAVASFSDDAKPRRSEPTSSDHGSAHTGSPPAPAASGLAGLGRPPELPVGGAEQLIGIAIGRRALEQRLEPRRGVGQPARGP